VHYGCIIAVCDLTQSLEMVANSGNSASREGNDTIAISSVSSLERAVGNWQPNRHALKLENVKPLILPVPAQGKQGLWIPDVQTIEQVEVNFHAATF
jgi:hypothetical protein